MMNTLVTLVAVCVLAHLACVEAAPGPPCSNVYCLWAPWCQKKLVKNPGNCCGFCAGEGNSNGNNGVNLCPYFNPYTRMLVACEFKDTTKCELQSDCRPTEKCCDSCRGKECTTPEIHECKDGASNTFWDGCSQCKCSSNGLAACTKDACASSPTK